MKKHASLSYGDAFRFAYTQLFKNIQTFVLLGLIWALLWPLLDRFEYFIENVNTRIPTDGVTSYYIQPFLITIFMLIALYILCMYYWYQLVNIGLALYKDQQINLKYAFSRSIPTFFHSLTARTLMWALITVPYIVFAYIYAYIFLKVPLIYYGRLSIKMIGMAITEIALYSIFLRNSVPDFIGFIVGVIVFLSFGWYLFTKFFFAGYPIIDNPNQTILQDVKLTRQITCGAQLRLSLIVLVQIVGTLVSAFILGHLSQIFMLIPVVRLDYISTVALYTLIYPLLILFNVHIYKQLKESLST